MKRTISVLFIIYLSLSMILTGCGKESPLTQIILLRLRVPTTVDQAGASDQLVEKFNDTEGKNFGIIQCRIHQ